MVGQTALYETSHMYCTVTAGYWKMIIDHTIQKRGTKADLYENIRSSGYWKLSCMKLYRTVDTKNWPLWNFTEQWILKVYLIGTIQNGGY